MACCARRPVSVIGTVCLCFALGVPAVHAQASGDLQAMSASSVSTAVTVITVEADVAAAIAVRWGVDATAVTVELISDAEWPVTGTPFRLVGTGDDGRWSVRFEAEPTARQLLVRAGVLASVVTAARDIERGVELSVADLRRTTEVRWGAPQSIGLQPQPGWVARRRIAQGEQVRRPAAEPPDAVKSGDDVTIEVIRGAVTLTLSGRAAGSAAIGEIVAVRAATGKRLEGVVIAPGLIRIGSMREDQ